MGKLQTGRFERLAARTYSIKGPGALVDLDETVLGVLLLERQGGMESHYIQEWETFTATNAVGPTVANFDWTLLHNPPGSGSLVVVDWFQNCVSSQIYTYMTRGAPPPFAVAGVYDAVDTRIPAARQSSARYYAATTNIGNFGTQVAISATTEKQHFTAVLGEDGSIAWRPSAVNVGMQLTVRWAERNAAPFEE